MKKLEKRAAAGAVGTGVKWVGGQPFVTDEAAKALSATFVLEAERMGGLKSVVRDGAARDQLVQLSAEFLGMEVKAALDTTTTPMPGPPALEPS